jgi:hypothetical protein
VVECGTVSTVSILGGGGELGGGGARWGDGESSPASLDLTRI